MIKFVRLHVCAEREHKSRDANKSYSSNMIEIFLFFIYFFFLHGFLARLHSSIVAVAQRNPIMSTSYVSDLSPASAGWGYFNRDRFK